MGEFKILKPKVPGVSCRDPKTGEKIPDEGKAVRMTSFWNRRLADGSMVEVGAPKTPEASAPKEARKTPSKED